MANSAHNEIPHGGTDGAPKVEFTLVRDKAGKVTYVVPGKAGKVIATFSHDPRATYHYSDDPSSVPADAAQRLDEALAAFPYVEKYRQRVRGILDANLKGFSDEDVRRIVELCGLNKKELLHKEDLLLADFSVADRMEAHTLPLAQVTCHCLLTCESAGKKRVVLAINNTSNPPAIEPFTTGGHVAATKEVKDLVSSRDEIPKEEFVRGLFGIIRGNMSKEIQEETGLVIPADKIRYFAADPSDPSKTHIRLEKNYSKVTKGNEESVHLFHASVNAADLARMVADQDDGVGGFVLMDMGDYERLALRGERVPVRNLDGSAAAANNADGLVGPENVNSEIAALLPGYASTFLALIRGENA